MKPANALTKSERKLIRLLQDHSRLRDEFEVEITALKKQVAALQKEVERDIPAIS